MKKGLLFVIVALLIACVGIAPVAAAEEPAMAAPIAKYTFDDPQNLGADSSGNGNHLQSLGGVSANAEGVSLGSVYFDGNGALVATPDAAGTDFVDALQTTTGQITLTYWYKATKEDIAGFDPNAHWRRIVSNGMQWDGYAGFTIINNPDNTAAPNVFYSNLAVEYNTPNYAGNHFAANIGFNEGWNFVAVTMDSAKNEARYYVNGDIVLVQYAALPAGATNIQFASPAAAFSLGCAYMPGIENPYFQSYKGSLDEVMIFSEVLTSAEVIHYMNQRAEIPEEPDPTEPDPTEPDPTEPQPTEPAENQRPVADGRPNPIGWYTFDDAAKPGADLSGNGNDLTALGNPVINTTGVHGGSVWFDGVSALAATAGAGGVDFVDALQDTTGQFSIAYWFKATDSDIAGFDANTTWRRIVSNGMVWDGQGGFTVINNPDNMEDPQVFYSNPFVEFNNGALAAEQFGADTPYTQDWVFAVITVDTAANKVCYYVNGKLAATLTPTVPAGATGLRFANTNWPLTFGAVHMPGLETPYFQSYKGALDEAMVFDCALTAEDVAYFMNYYNSDPPADTGDNVTALFAALIAAPLAMAALVVCSKRLRREYK